MIPIRAHILFKGPSQGDLYFLQLEECEHSHLVDSYKSKGRHLPAMAKKPIERSVAPIGKTSLIIARCDVKGSICSLDDLAAREDREDYQLALGTFALKSNPGAQQVLVNFDNAQGAVMILASIDTRNSPQKIAKSS